jgi:hypothetical protein
MMRLHRASARTSLDNQKNRNRMLAEAGLLVAGEGDVYRLRS